MIKFEQEALNYAKVKSLPKEVEGAFEGLAIVKVTKFGGKEMFAIGKWNEKLGRCTLAHDFDKLMLEDVISAHPYQDGKIKANKAKDNALNEANKRIAELEKEAVDGAVLKLKTLGVEDPQGTLEELKAQIIAKEAELANDDLDKMRSFLLSVGYTEIYCKNLTFESGKKSVEKIEKLQADITALGGTPAATKDEMEAQLKELKKAK